MLSVFLSLSLAFAKDAPEFTAATKSVGTSRVNWTDMQIEAKSAYASRQESWELKENWASKAVGEKIKESILHLKLDAKHTLGTYLEEKNQLSKTFTAGVDEWQTAETRYFQNSAEVEVVGRLDLKHFLRQLRMQRASSEIGELTPKEHTALLIDARGLDFYPVVFPEVVSANGDALISIRGFSRKAAQTMNFGLYVNDPAHPKAAALLGDNPAIVRAVDVESGVLKILESDRSFLPNSEDLAAINAMGLMVIILD